MTESEVKAYGDFMFNAENAYACDRCPENKGESSNIEKKLPCGQQNCWVVCHVRSQEGKK